MRTTVKDKIHEPEISADNGGHYHYWKIEPAEGPTSRGICKLCGEEREFLNSVQKLTLVKRHANPLTLPKIKTVEFDGKHRKS